MPEEKTLRDLGTGELEDGSRADFERMNAGRLSRCLAEMDRQNLDVLILGREGNARFVSGARRLWTSGIRPFGPGCVVVRESRQVHLLSVWDDGIPAAIPRENLFGLSWNPLNLMNSIREIHGVADARRVGVDGMTPLFAQLLPLAAPNAQLVNGDEMMRALRMVKTADEVRCIATAVAITEAGLDAVLAAIRPGVKERALAGVFGQRICDFGIQIPATEGVFCATPRSGSAAQPPFRQVISDRELAEGDLVAASSGVMFAGFEGGVGRTQLCSANGRASDAQRKVYERWTVLRKAVLGAIRPGASGAEVRRAYVATGEPLPAFPILHGVGLGFEPPMIGSPLGERFDAAWALQAGMVLAFQGYAWSAGVGGYFGKEMLLVTEDGNELLTRFGDGALAR